MGSPYNYSGSGGILSGGTTGFMPSLAGGGGAAAGGGAGAIASKGGDIISNLLNIIPSIFQSILGGKQLKQANKIESQTTRPEAEIAPSINELINRAYAKTLSNDIPGGDLYRGEIKGATAAGMRAASELGSGSEAYGMLGELVGREQNSFSELAKITAQQVAGYEGNYQNALGVKAGEENRVWDWNKAQPYLQAAQIAAQLRDSGMKNLYSGVANIFGSSAEATSPDLNSSTLLGGNGKNGSGGPSLEEFMKWQQSFNSKGK